MTTTPFDADAGIGQGRIQPTDGPAFEGAYVLQLGHDEAGDLRNFLGGDSNTFAQTSTFTTGTRVLRMRARLRPARVLPAGGSWTVSISVDGAPHASIMLDPTSPIRSYADLAANVGPLGGGSHTVSLALAFAGTGLLPFVAELPGVAFDELVEDPTVASPGISNRSPEPGWAAVPLAGPIAFDLYDTEGGTVDVARTIVYVNGVAILASGVALLAGWLLSVGGTSAPGAVRLSFTPTVPLAPATTYTVRVVSAVVGGPADTLDTTWTFTTVDTVAPTVLSAMALDASTVLVSFSKPMTQASATGATDTLNPANYAISLFSAPPAVTPTVASVAPGASSASALLTTSDPMTAGTVYLLVVTGVEDALGNAIAAPPQNQAQLVYAGCPAPAGRDSSLWNLLPLGVRASDVTGELKRFIQCFQLIYDELLCDVDRWTAILDPDTAPEPFLDAMLADLGNPFTIFALDVVHKRQLARLLVPLYQLKGTDQGMIDAIRLFTGVTVTIQTPWWQGIWSLGESYLGSDTVLGTGDLHTIYGFYVVSPVILTSDQVAAIEFIVAYMRRAPTHLLGIIQPTPPPPTPNHWELGLSHLGTETFLH